MSQARSGKVTILAAVFLVLAISYTKTFAADQPTTVTIDAAQTGEPISKYIYGQFIEHLGRCIYGGIWAEMLEDRKFYFPITADYKPYRGTRAVPEDSPYAVVGASPWQIIGPPDSVTMVTEDSFVGEHTPLMKPGAGIRQLDLGLVANRKYVGYLYLKPQQENAKLRVSLHWGNGPDNSQSVQVQVAGQKYGKHPFELTAGADTNKGKLEINVVDGACFVGTVSLMPKDNIEGMRADTLAVLKELNAPLYRWPGGNFVSGYDWRDGIGDRDTRPPRKNPAWTGVEHNDFGMHEFIRFCRILKAEPLITVNTGFGDAYSAAAELEYSNGSTKTLMGALRAKNGAPEPFNVRYWCIGNEMWGRWQLGYMSLNHYVQKHNWVVNKMREVDPNIIPIASGNAGRWSEGLLQNCSDHIDQIAEHFYCQERPDVVAHTAWIAENIRSKVDFHRKLREELDVLKGKDIQIAMTEWNYWYGPHLFGELGTRYFHKDGIGIARGLHEYYRNSDIMIMANYAQTVNVIGCIKASKTAAGLETTGLVLKLYGNNYGSIPVATTSDSDSIDVSAALTNDRKVLTLSIVNPTDREQQLALNIKGFELAGTGKLRFIANSDPQAHNDPGQAPKVVIEEEQLANVSSRLRVPRLSISLYALQAKVPGAVAISRSSAEPVIFTTEEDHRNMMAQLGITKLRPGRSPNEESPNYANYDEAKANPYPKLPPLLDTEEGEKLTTAEQWWKTRRPEIVELLEREVYGRIPQDVPAVHWEVRQTREVEAGGKPAIQRELVGVVDNSACPEIKVNIAMSLTLPKDASGPVPVLMSFGWTPFDLERFNFSGFRRRGNGPRPPSKRDLLIAAGWGCATLNPSTVQDDSGGWQPRRFGPGADPNAKPTGAGLTRGIIGVTNQGQPRKPDQWGALRAWGWGASRALDYLETVAEVDSERVGIAGVSRYGKAALVAMAFDQRFAAGLIASSGAGGTALYRRNFGESLENLAGSGAYHWMAGNYLKYATEESSFGRRTAADLPVDSNMAIALCAPRLTFISHGIPEEGDAHWLDHQGSFMAAVAAQPVFRLLGAHDLGRSDDYINEKMPGVNVDLLDGALAWRQHDGGHTDGPNVKHFVRWAEAHWAGNKAERVSRNSQPDRRSLIEAVGDRFKIGVGVGHFVLRNAQDAALIRQHFQILTPENCMKPQSIHPAEDQWDFEPTDRFVDFARANKLDVVGHCLVWAKDDRTDEWMMTENGKPVSRETLLRRIETHINSVVERYGDAVTMWDVVNEAIGDGDDGLLRDSVYSRTTGIDFIVTAFKAARAKDPDALLIYNDYNGHKPGKREKLIELLTQLKQRGAPVDSYGMQGHFELGDDSVPQLRETFNQLRNLNIKVVVSELDIDVVTRGRWWADGGKYRNELATHDPYKDGIPDEIQQRQIEQYVGLFGLFDEYSDIIERVSFWNLHDGQSWLNYFPWRRVNHPLLFDRNRRPKPVFDAVYESLQTATSASAHVPVPHRDENFRIDHEQLLAKQNRQDRRSANRPIRVLPSQRTRSCHAFCFVRQSRQSLG